MAEYTPLVMVSGNIQQQPVGDILKLRGNLDTDTYIVTAAGDLIIQPGATYALRADSTGNARGSMAVDFQMERSADDQVASGLNSVVIGGRRNTASSSYTFVGGGWYNQSTNYASAVGGGGANEASGSYAFVGGGSNNDVHGSMCSICGGSGNDISSSGYRSIICAGYLNDIDGDYSIIGGGRENWIRSNCIYAVICGGYDNECNDADHGFIGGGYANKLNSTSNWGVIGGGDSNIVTATGGCVGGGQDNTISGLWSFIGGGENNDIQNQYGVIGGGLNNVVSGDYGTVPGGRQNTAGSQYSVAMGYLAETTLLGEVTQASGQFATPGDAQTSVLVVRNATSDATTTVLYLDGSSATLNMPQDSTWGFDIYVAAHRQTGESAGYHLQGVIRRAGTANPVIVGTRIKTVLAEDDATWDADVQVDTINDALEVYVNGAAGKDIGWCARVELTIIKG